MKCTLILNNEYKKNWWEILKRHLLDSNFKLKSSIKTLVLEL